MIAFASPTFCFLSYSISLLIKLSTHECLLLLFHSVDVSKKMCSGQPTGVNPQLCVMAKPKRIHALLDN